jgi:hypothetical protein
MSYSALLRWSASSRFVRSVILAVAGSAAAFVVTPAGASFMIHGGGGFRGGGFHGGMSQPHAVVGGFNGGAFQRHTFVFDHHRFPRRFVFVRNGFGPGFVAYGYDDSYRYYDSGCYINAWGPFGWRVINVCDY